MNKKKKVEISEKALTGAFHYLLDLWARQSYDSEEKRKLYAILDELFEAYRNRQTPKKNLEKRNKK